MIAKMFDPTKPVQTRLGRKARIIGTDRKDTVFPITAIVESKSSDGDDHETVLTFTKEGGLEAYGDTVLDLVNVPQKRVAYVVLFNETEDGSFSTSRAYVSEDLAKVAGVALEAAYGRQSSPRVLEVEWEE